MNNNSPVAVAAVHHKQSQLTGGHFEAGAGDCITLPAVFYVTVVSLVCVRAWLQAEVHIPVGAVFHHKKQQLRERGSVEGARHLVDNAAERRPTQPGVQSMCQVLLYICVLLYVVRLRESVDV